LKIESCVDSNVKKKWSIFAKILLVLLVVLVVSLFVGYRIAKNKIIFLLSNPIDLGSALIIPQNFQTDFPFKFSWESVVVKLCGTDLFLEKPKISLRIALRARQELLNVSVDSIHAKIIPGEGSNSVYCTEDEKKMERISHPDLRLPFRLSINVNKAAVDVKGIGSWNLDSLVAAKSGRQKRIYIKAKDIRGTHLAKNLFLNADYSWNETFSDALISISDKTSDSLVIALNAPRKNLEYVSAEIKADVANLPPWLNDKWPNKAPGIEKINLYSNASANILTGKADFNLTLKAKAGKFWQLPAFDVAIKAMGNNSGISQSEISLNGNNGESVKFKGNINRKLDGSGELEVKGINITLGPETLPTDVKFHKITKSGNSVSANFTTGAGSNFTAKMADINNPVITFAADLAPKEPWAVQWTEGMVKLANPTILTGSFSFKDIILRANLKTGVPFAYYASADELDVSLWLDPEGIRFPQGTIRRKGYKSDFSGEVMWDKKYFAFKLNQSGGGEAEVYGTFDPKIDLNLQKLNTRELPFADTAMLKGYSGFVSGNWKHDFENRNGLASVEVSTVIQDFTIDVKSDVEIRRDSLMVKKFELRQNEEKVEGSLFALLPNESGRDFEIQQTSINIPNMDLISLLAAFKDSTLSSGYIRGNLEYDKKAGLAGDLTLSKIVLRGLDSNLISFSDFHLEALGQSATVYARIFIGDGLWNGNLEVSVDKIGQESNLPIHITYSADNLGNAGSLKFEGFLSKGYERIFGNAQVLGDWFLPTGMGEIKNADIKVSARSVLGKNILDSLVANFSTGQNFYEYGIFKIPFAFSGRVARGMLTADSIFVYNEQNSEKITAKLAFDLKNAVLKDLSFNTEQFTLLLLNEHLFQIKNGTGKTKLDSAGITIFAELPSISYGMKSKDYGTANANLTGQLAYRFPFHTGQAQTNPSITGSFDINNASYATTLDIMPDLYNFEKSMKNINKFISTVFREKKTRAAEKHALTSRPTTLNVKIQTRMEAITVSSNIAKFAFVASLTAQGTTRNILLSGDINSMGSGKIGYSGLTMFDLSSFRAYWQSSAIKNGRIELSASNEYPMCSTMGTQNEEFCTISINLDGPLTKLNMRPTASCNIEASPALIYYSMLLGCISENYDSGLNFDRDRLTGKIVGKTLSSGLNRVFGGDVIGDIDFRYQFFNDTQQEQDTTFHIKVPFSLSKWVPNLEIIVGYTNDNSLNSRAYESYEAGFRYRLPVFDSTDINRNLIDPSLDISTNVVARRYLSTMESAQDESRLEGNAGLLYRHKFWDPCILGIGHCKVP